MKKYEKPQVRDLGSMLPNAQGACGTGLTPKTNHQCTNGISASGQCNNGGTVI